MKLSFAGLSADRRGSSYLELPFSGFPSDSTLSSDTYSAFVVQGSPLAANMDEIIILST